MQSGSPEVLRRLFIEVNIIVGLRSGEEIVDEDALGFCTYPVYAANALHQACGIREYHSLQ